MWSHLYRSDSRLTLKKKSYSWTFALFLQMLSQRRHLNVVSKDAIFFLIIDFFLSFIWRAFIFHSLKLLRLCFFWISFVWLFWLFSFFCHCFWHILVNFLSDDFLFIFVVTFEIRKSLRLMRSIFSVLLTVFMQKVNDFFCIRFVRQFVTS